MNGITTHFIPQVTPYPPAANNWIDRNKHLLDFSHRQTLDEMTDMKILSRIEGDEERTKKVLEDMKALVNEQIAAKIPPADDGKPQQKSLSAAKIEEMLAKLKATGFTSYWT